MDRGLGKASELIFVKVSIAGVEVDALVDTGATTSCCRWDWYQGWKDHLGTLTKSKVGVIGVGHDPIKVKGLTKPLTLQWDGVGGQLQLMVLTALTDVDVVLGMDVLRQLDVKINFKKQVASPAREACTPLEPAKTVGLLLNKPGFTFKGKIPVKEEGVEEVAKGVLRQAYREVHRVWMASERKMKTKDKRKDRKIVRGSSMPWNQAGYKAQLQKDLQDIRQKLSQVLGKDLAKSDKSFVEATSPVNCIEGGVLVDLCMQRSGKRGSGCDAPNEADRFPRSADGSFKASKGFPTPVTSPLRPPKPPRTEVRQYSWRNSTRKEVCMYIRIQKPLKTRKEKEELKFKQPGSTNCRNHSDVMVSGVIAEPNNDVTIRDIVDVNTPIARKRYAPRKQSLMPSEGSFKSSLRVCSRTFTFIALLLAIVISVSGGLFNIRLPERKSTVGTSASLSLFESFVAISCHDSLFLSILRESSANILGINEGLCPCMMAETSWNNNKELIRRMEVLHNTIIRDKGGYVYSGCHGYVMPIMQSFARTFLAGKRLVIYIFPSADFWASQVYYFDAYTVNLELDDNFKVFFDLVYLYIFNFYRSWPSCSWATYPAAIFIKIYTLVYFYPKVMVLIVKSHDKYQSLILIGLAPAEKASSENRSVLDHYRSYWRKW